MISPPCPAVGTFIVAKMLCRSLSWMGWDGLVAPAERAGPAGVLGVGAGEGATVADGVMGVVGTWEEPRRVGAEVDDGVAAVDWLRELKMKEEYFSCHWIRYDIPYPSYYRLLPGRWAASSWNSTS